MAKVDTTARLAELRKLMKERNVDVYSTGPPRSPTDPRD
jgi:sugar phosphate isomerase/epimerase|tara:strand:- start:1463 stop:1579 length:117 start_codon:yes stop_codon:yes gene_type:complete